MAGKDNMSRGSNELMFGKKEQVRALVDQVSNQKARDAILRIVADYELLAFRAQERAKR